MFEVVFAASRSRSSGARWPSGRSSGCTSPSARIFTLIYSIVSHWIWSPDGWLFARGMQDFAGSTVVHYQGALAGLAGAILLGPRIGKFGTDGKSNAIPGHNMAFTTLGVLILWFGWFGFNPGSTLSVDFGGVGFFAYVALNTNLAAAAGVLGAVVTSWLVIKKPDLSMMLNGAIAALVAITAACAFVAPWAAILIGFVAGVIVVFGVLLVERIGIDDPVGAVAVHGMAGVWGTLSLGFLTVPALADEARDRLRRALLRWRPPPARDQALGLAAVGAFTFTASFAILFAHEDDLSASASSRGRGGGPGRVRARDVGLPRVLHPGPGRLRDRVAQPSGRRDVAVAASGTATRRTRRRRSTASSGDLAEQVWRGGPRSSRPRRAQRASSRRRRRAAGSRSRRRRPSSRGPRRAGRRSRR